MWEAFKTGHPNRGILLLKHNQDVSYYSNFEIAVGVNNWGAYEFDSQVSAIRGAGITLAPNAEGYRVDFDTQIYSFDSYDGPGTAAPAPGAVGYWDLVNGGGAGSIADPVVATLR